MGDVIRLRKPHPCSSYEWEVTRLGADIGLRCGGCGRRLLVGRSTLERRLKTFVTRGEPINEEQLNAIFSDDEAG